MLCVKRDRRQSLTEIMQTKCIMSCQTRFLQGLFVDKGSQGEIFVRPSPFRPRTDIAVYIGVDKNLDRLNKDLPVIFSDETHVVVDSNKRDYVWRCHDEVWQPECLGLVILNFLL